MSLRTHSFDCRHSRPSIPTCPAGTPNIFYHVIRSQERPSPSLAFTACHYLLARPLFGWSPEFSSVSSGLMMHAPTFRMRERYRDTPAPVIFVVASWRLSFSFWFSFSFFFLPPYLSSFTRVLMLWRIETPKKKTNFTTSVLSWVLGRGGFAISGG